MTPINLLINAVDNLWYWTYSIVVGWGASFTIIIAVLIFMATRLLRLSRRVNQLESRLIHAERDYNISINATKNK